MPKPQRLVMLVQSMTGARFSEFARRDQEDFDLEAGTLSIQHEPGKGKAVKNKHSIRVIPSSELTKPKTLFSDTSQPRCRDDKCSSQLSKRRLMESLDDT